MSDRLTSLPDGVGDLVDRVPDEDILGCLHALAVAALSVVGYYAGEAEDALSELRDRGTVLASKRMAVNALFAQRQQFGFAAGRRGDIVMRDKVFYETRALNCVVYAVGAVGESPRQRLREAAYEAATAFRGTSGVVSVVSRYAG